MRKSLRNNFVVSPNLVTSCRTGFSPFRVVSSRLLFSMSLLFISLLLAYSLFVLLFYVLFSLFIYVFYLFRRFPFFYLIFPSPSPFLFVVPSSLYQSTTIVHLFQFFVLSIALSFVYFLFRGKVKRASSYLFCM